MYISIRVYKKIIDTIGLTKSPTNNSYYELIHKMLFI